jgi:putative photosynthetic complex assembly protein 2
MTEYLVPLAFAVLVWWLSTGTALLLVRRSPRTYGLTMTASTLLMAAAFVAIWISRDTTTATSAYIGFLSGLAVWIWSEMSFLLGYVTGPVTTRCPKGARGWLRFKLATGTVLYHELSILAGGAVVAALSWGADNQVALWTYLVLWFMRLSAKLNIFLGVLNKADELLPACLNHLPSYFGHRAITPFFGVSVTIGTVATAVIYHAASGDPYQIAGTMLVATLMA